MSTQLSEYVETALWSSNDESDESGGNPMDDNYTMADIAPESLATMQSDIDQFVERCGALLDSVPDHPIMHDFWLTRNGHGAGFWDGDYPEPIGDQLTKIAESFGECWLYVGDDGRVYS